MKKNWNVTYEIVTPESAEEGDADERGYEAESVSFRSALSIFGDYAESADSWPISRNCPPRWFDSTSEPDFYDGSEKRLSLHIPEQITPASRIRLARYLRLKV